jgi:membrane protease YdiL (CAAX protease family)
MTALDFLYLALITIGLLLDHFVLWPAFVRQSSADPGRARLRLWSRWMILLWTLTAVGIGLWLFEARDWRELRFVSPQGWRLWGSVGFILTSAIIFAQPIVRMARSTRRKRIKVANPRVEQLSPRTRSELRWWIALSLSAGFCEEFIFRGYLIWAFQLLFGSWGAAAFSVVVFAMAHAYQGAKGILAVGVVGALFTLVVLMSGSLWPAIALHALVDISQGLVGWLALRDEPTVA